MAQPKRENEPDETSALVHLVHTRENYLTQSGFYQRVSDAHESTDARERCRVALKCLAFGVFLVLLSVGLYFTIELFEPKGDFNFSEVSQDIRTDTAPLFINYNVHKEDTSMLKVTNCGQTNDISTDSELYQTDIRAAANYLKTYWQSYSSFITTAISPSSTGNGLDPSCLQQQFEEGEVICKDIACVYDNQCVSKTSWDAVSVCKYAYFDIGGLKDEQRPDRRACIASMLVQQWSSSCWQQEQITDEMASATFEWWKATFTVSDDWNLDSCPCS